MSDAKPVKKDEATPVGLDLMRAPFPPNQISKLPKPTKQQTEAVRADFKSGVRCEICGLWHHPKVVHLDYVGHAALTDRLLNCDPSWNWEPMAFTPTGTPLTDENGGMWIKLTVCGVTRFGYGHPDGKKGGDAIKEVIGDALRNAAMRFGAALDLWHKGELHQTEDAPQQIDPKEEFEAAVSQALRDIDREKDLDSLSALWADLYRKQRPVADDRRVIAAKDKRKTELTPRPTDDLSEDEIPY